MIEIVFLGTSAMVPTKERNVSSILLNYNENYLLFDCGEGTQRQMNIANINRNKVKKIFITHWHGDHVAGLVGLIQTIGNQLFQRTIEIEKRKNEKYESYDDIYNESPKLEIFGPKGTKKYMKHIMQCCAFENKVDITVKEFDCEKIKKIYDCEDYVIEAVNVEHKAPCLAYSFIEKDKIRINKEYLDKNHIADGPHLRLLKEGKVAKYNGKVIDPKLATYTTTGKKITLIIDTTITANVTKIAENSDLLVCESSYSSELQDKAREYKHLTSKDAALIASKSNSQKLVLTHISQRYKNAQELIDDAKDIFSEAICAFDFMKLKL